VNIPGWRSKRKIVIIESDDWGSIRMPSKEVFHALLKKGIRIDLLSYNKYDSLASEEDLALLFEILYSVKDKYGNPALITANTIVANPDFDKIHAAGFNDYFYEPFTETLKRYPKHAKSFELMQQGMNEGVFKPQFHGREHLNVFRWIKALKNDVENVRTAFNYRMYDLSDSIKISENSFMEAFNYESESELSYQQQSIVEGTNLFEKLFGYRSKTFIAPCYIWSNHLNSTLLNCGIEGFNGNWIQLEPVSGKEHRFEKRFHFTGQKNKLMQHYLVRNVSFEPSQNEKFDNVGNALIRIKDAFRYGKPAIISTHRVNFIGFIDPKNRNKNLPQFHDLLKMIVKLWPDVEFMSSDQLLNIIQN
jgi:hypothetical protein